MRCSSERSSIGDLYAAECDVGCGRRHTSVRPQGLSEADQSRECFQSNSQESDPDESRADAGLELLLGGIFHRQMAHVARQRASGHPSRQKFHVRRDSPDTAEPEDHPWQLPCHGGTPGTRLAQMHGRYHRKPWRASPRVEIPFPQGRRGRKYTWKFHVWRLRSFSHPRRGKLFSHPASSSATCRCDRQDTRCSLVPRRQQP